MSEVPSYSFVATSRNDDHGGDVLRRTQTFIARLAEQCERHQVRSELVLVEWNPPSTRASLEDVLGWPAGSEWFSARVVTVPPALHREFTYSERLALFQMIAKNVGIRRASGKYVIATNIDIIFNDKLFETLRVGDFREGVVYRSDRWDIPNEIQSEQNLDVLLDRAGQEAIRRNRRDGTYVKREGLFVNITETQFDDFYHNLRTNQLCKLRRTLEENVSLSHDAVLYHLDEIIDVEMPRLRRNFLIPLLHVHACGDFTMMSRRDWFALRGYPEWNTFSWNIDAIILYQAHYNGLEIAELEETCVHYHIEHDHGSGWTPEGEGSLRERLDALGIPYIWYGPYIELIYELQDNAEAKLVTVYNKVDWGLDAREVECRMLVEPDSSPRPPTAVNEGQLDEDFLKELIPVTPGIRFDGGERCADGVKIEWRATEDGEAELAVDTLPAMWSYAFYYDLLPLVQRSGEYWVKVQLIVDQGEIAVSVLNLDRSNFLSQVRRVAEPRMQEVLIRIKDIGETSQIIFRNITPDNQPSCFRLRGVELLREDTDTDGTTVSGPVEAAAKRETVRLTFALRQTDGPEHPPEPAPPAQLGAASEAASAFEPGTARLSEIRANAPDVIVRVLRSQPERAANSGAECQAMIILPSAGGWDAGAVLDLGGPKRGTDRVRIYLHVLEGEAAIGLTARATGEILAESCERAGLPLTQIDLDVNGAETAGALVIRNTSLSGPTKLLLHRVELNAAAGP